MKLHIDAELYKFLELNGHRNLICSILYDLTNEAGFEYRNGLGFLTTDINWIRRSIDSSEMISYLPVKKYDENIDPFTDGIGRMQVRTGRFINKLLTKKCFDTYNIKDSDVEDFVNLFKTESTKYEGTYFKIVEGSDINKYYNCDFYFRSEEGGYRGTLWQSCMRHPEMHKYFNIYADNCKMLILFSQDDRVMGRALLWDTVTTPDKLNSYKFMDRIYFYEESDVELFKIWASDNGYITKYTQDSYSYSQFIVGGEQVNLELQVELVKSEYVCYPFFDTFRFLCCNLGYLRNFDRLGKTYILIQTDGTPEVPSEDDEECEDNEDD